jgi:hypothetical protein
MDFAALYGNTVRLFEQFGVNTEPQRVFSFA